MSPFHVDWPIMFKYTFSISIVFWFLSVHDYCQILRNIVDTSTLYSPVELSTDQFLLCLSQLAISSYFSSGSCWRGISLLSVGNILPAGGGEIGVWPDPASSLYIPPCCCCCWYLPLESLSVKLRVEHRKLSPADSQPQPATSQQGVNVRAWNEDCRRLWVTWSFTIG